MRVLRVVSSLFRLNYLTCSRDRTAGEFSAYLGITNCPEGRLVRSCRSQNSVIAYELLPFPLISPS